MAPKIAAEESVVITFAGRLLEEEATRRSDRHYCFIPAVAVMVSSNSREVQADNCWHFDWSWHSHFDLSLNTYDYFCCHYPDFLSHWLVFYNWDWALVLLLSLRASWLLPLGVPWLLFWPAALWVPLWWRVVPILLLLLLMRQVAILCRFLLWSSTWSCLWTVSLFSTVSGCWCRDPVDYSWLLSSDYFTSRCCTSSCSFFYFCVVGGSLLGFSEVLLKDASAAPAALPLSFLLVFNWLSLSLFRIYFSKDLA